MSQEASLTEIKNFFEYDSPTRFKNDWVRLSEEERKYFKQAVGAEIHPSE